ncbi:MAG: hypothetical protein KKI12_09910 [Proteobacteria bacterium]|nr:hypothetical protein [Pseudomonadota bacterium]
MILKAVFLISLSSLTFEILLTRVFSISQWNHLSFMVISMALFGFAASGTFLSILGSRKKGWETKLSSGNPLTILVILYCTGAIASFIVMNRIPLDYFRLPLEPIQVLYLLTVYILLSLPFFIAGLILTVAYSFMPEKTGFVYFSSMVGSACGALISWILLPFFGEGKLIIFSSLIPLIIVFFTRTESLQADNLSSRIKKALPATCLAIALIAVIFLSPAGDSITEVKPSSYKALSQLLQFPDTYIAETSTSIRGRIDTVKSPYIHFAPGLSLNFQGSLPDQHAVFRDGDNQLVLYDMFKQNEQFPRFTIPYAGYLLVPDPKNVLLILCDGGAGIPCSIASGADEITIIEQNPQTARIVRNHYNLSVINQNPRAFLAQSNERFQIIHVENWGTSLPGSAALTQEYLFTIDAFKQYLNRLTKQGVLIISRKLLLPPSDSIRLWASAYEGLRELGIKNPEYHIVIMRNWGTFTMIVSAQPLQDTSIIEKFARARNFDLVYTHDISPDMPNRFNIFDKPYHFLEIRRLEQAYKSGTEKAYYKNYFLDVAPQSDNRPFPSRFLKWSGLKNLYKTTGSRPYSIIMSGEIVVAVVFIEAVLVALLLLIIPLIAFLKNNNKPSINNIIYFISVGAGFMFVELYFIKEYTLIFGDPVISFTIVITGILVFSGIGGLCSQRITHRALNYCLVIFIITLLLIFIGLDTIIHKMLRLSYPYQLVISFMLLMPPGFIMGLPFPLGMRYLLKTPVQRAYAWTANGCASVLATIASVQIALSIGIPSIMACAVLAYLVSFLCISCAKK